MTCGHPKFRNSAGEIYCSHPDCNIDQYIPSHLLTNTSNNPTYDNNIRSDFDDDRIIPVDNKQSPLQRLDETSFSPRHQ